MRDATAAVIGTSMFAKAIAAEFLRNGASVFFLDDSCASSSMPVRIKEGGVFSSYSCPCSADWRRAGEAAYVVSCQTGEELFRAAAKLAGVVSSGQLIVLFPGYFMAGKVAEILGAPGASAGVDGPAGASAGVHGPAGAMAGSGAGGSGGAAAGAWSGMASGALSANSAGGASSADGGAGICEMTSAPVVCSMSADGVVHILKRKQKLKYALYSAQARSSASVPDPALAPTMTPTPLSALAPAPTPALMPSLAGLKEFLPMLSLVPETTETSLENINSILHPLPILLNLAAVRRSPDTFRHFIDGIDEGVSRLLHLMDEERLAVGKALGLELEPVLSQLKSYYGDNEARTIHEYIHTPECPYAEIRGYGLSSRYITLDVPNLVGPTRCAWRAKMACPSPYSRHAWRWRGRLSDRSNRIPL